MLIRQFFPSLFLRRVLLLALCLVLAGVPLAVQLSRLTIARGAQLREEAESRLVKRQWTPAVRGTILDRKGRILAQDRPSFDVAVDFSVLSGEWPQRQAATIARRSYGHAGWLNLSPAERDEAIATLVPVYQVHVEQGWDRLAAVLGVERAALDARRDQVVLSVNSLRELLTRRRIEEETAAAVAAGKALTEADLRAIARRADQPIAESRRAHTLAARVSDEVGFAAAALASDDSLPPAVNFPDGRPAALEAVPVLPGLRVTDSGDRDYPYEAMTIGIDRRSLPKPVRADDTLTVDVEGVACHIVGRLRDRVFGDQRAGPGDDATNPGEPAPPGERAVIPGDQSKRTAFLNSNPDIKAIALTPSGEDRGAYREGDRVGDAGLESSREHELRGLRGLVVTHLDTGKKDVTPAMPGANLALTLDIMLQARVQALMSREVGLAVVQPWHQQQSDTQPIGTMLNGAAVVLDIDSGEVLAMVSTPTYTRRQLREEPDSVFKDPVNSPFVNRCVGKPYPPGSIIKAAVLAGAVTAGNYTPGQRIPCNGYLLPNRPDIYRCLIYKVYHTTHSIVLGHDPDGREALMASCNVFFFTMGSRMGVDGIVPLFRSLGVGAPYRLGVGGEFAGQIGKHNDGSDLRAPDAIQMAIGQGPIAWTPLHAADTFATLARGGVRLQPTVVKARSKQPPEDVGWTARSVELALAGLSDVVNAEQGTGRLLTFEDGVREPIFNAPGVRVWGKTGTADAPDIRGPDPDGSGPLSGPVLKTGDHSWFVILAGRDRPRYVIAVVIDYGGSGGKVSGPIANQIVHALQAEGYL